MKRTRQKLKKKKFAPVSRRLNPNLPPTLPADSKTLSKTFFLAAAIFIVTFIVFSGALRNDFTNFDDNDYITENAHVQQGLTVESFRWAFSTNSASNWHPLTWLSHMADCEFFNLNPAGHHFTNILLHALNAVLLFMVFRLMTGDLWRSAFIAAFFALHPLRVESAAWASERKDVLSTFFWLLTMIAYVRMARQKRLSWYLAALAAFAAGLMAKPMLVTLPFVLLLLDYWPLNRLDPQSPLTRQMKTVFVLVREKIPFFILAFVSCAVTFYAQQSGDAVKDLSMLSLKFRLGNASISYISYIGKMLWPVNLAVFYPHPGNAVSWPAVAAATAALLIIFALVFTQARKRPWLATGWLWYFGTLVPVIGLVQVGAQSSADRYTYVPLIGLSVIIAWLVPKRITRRQGGRLALIAITCAVLLALSICTCIHIPHWRNSITLFSHAAEVTKDNYRAQFNLAKALSDTGQIDKAAHHYSIAVTMKPAWPEAHHNLGITFFKQGKLAKAIDHYTTAIELKPDRPETHNNLGVALEMQKQFDRAITHYNQAIELKPDYANAHYNLAKTLAITGRNDEAIEQYRRVLRIAPQHSVARRELEQLLTQK